MTNMISFVAPATTSATSKDTAAATLAGNYDTFLKILTAQIQNQDPLQPMDSSQFTQQLVQFSGVEQQIKSNQSLDTLIKSSQSNAGASLAGYLGQLAQINQAGAEFSGSPVNWSYNLPSGAASATVTVSDAKGNIVYSASGGTSAGDNAFTWNGALSAGGTATTGGYYLKVDAKDATGAAITATPSVIATITGVDLSYGEPALTTTAGVYSYADVTRLTKQ